MNTFAAASKPLHSKAIAFEVNCSFALAAVLWLSLLCANTVQAYVMLQKMYIFVNSYTKHEGEC